MSNPYRHTTSRLGKVRNPFDSPYRVMALIMLPVLAFGFTLALIYTGPNRDAYFGDSKVHGAQSRAYWCSQWSMDQVTPELQAHADTYRLTAEFASLCG